MPSDSDPSLQCFKDPQSIRTLNKKIHEMGFIFKNKIRYDNYEFIIFHHSIHNIFLKIKHCKKDIQIYYAFEADNPDLIKHYESNFL